MELGDFLKKAFSSFEQSKELKNWEKVSYLWSNIQCPASIANYECQFIFLFFRFGMSVVISSILICIDTLHETSSERFIVLVIRCVITFPYLLDLKMPLTLVHFLFSLSVVIRQIFYSLGCKYSSIMWRVWYVWKRSTEE